jgi:hypothetical protein
MFKNQYTYNHYAVVVQLVERLLAKEKVAGSNPVYRSKKHLNWVFLYLIQAKLLFFRLIYI